MADNEEISKEEFINKMEKFEKETARKILELMENEQYMLPVTVLGLISIVRALIENFGNEALREEATHFLNLDTSKLHEMSSDIPEADDIVKEEE